MNDARPLAGKRILFVLGTLRLGGAERQAILLAGRLVQEAGAAVQIWGLDGDVGEAAELCRQHDLEWRTCSFASPPSLWGRLEHLLRLARILRRERPDVIMPYYRVANTACGLIWRITGAQLCIWNQRDAGLEMPADFARRWSVRLTPAFVSNSASGTEFLCQSLKVPRQRVLIIANGVQLPEPAVDKGEYRRQVGIPPDAFVGMMLANLTNNKDHLTAIRAWRRVADRLGDCPSPPILLLAGYPGATAPQVRKLIHELGLDEQVRLLGQVRDVSSLAHAVDLSVFSSPSEARPNGVLESMAAGLCVVATDIPGVRETLGDDARCLFPVGDDEACADRIVNLAQNEPLRRQLGECNREKVIREFSPDEMVRQSIQVIADGLASSPWYVRLGRWLPLPIGLLRGLAYLSGKVRGTCETKATSP